MNIVPMRADAADDIRAQITKAEQFADVCDAIVIVMQKREGGMVYFINDGATVAGANWLMDCLKQKLMDMAKV